MKQTLVLSSLLLAFFTTSSYATEYAKSITYVKNNSGIPFTCEMQSGNPKSTHLDIPSNANNHELISDYSKKKLCPSTKGIFKCRGELDGNKVYFRGKYEFNYEKSCTTTAYEYTCKVYQDDTSEALNVKPNANKEGPHWSSCTLTVDKK